MSIIRKYICVVLPFLLLFGCASKPGTYVILLENETGETGSITVSNNSGTQVIDKKGYGINLYSAAAPPGEPTQINEKEIKTVFAKALEVQPDPPSRFILYFIYDKTVLTAKSKDQIDDIILDIKKREVPKIGISGHTDRSGDYEYNNSLALSRAKSVKKILLSSGVQSEYIVDVTSHGENNPIIKTRDGVVESKNRRVEVIVR